MNLTSIFNEYNTVENIPFYNLSKSVVFPEDNTLKMYEYMYITEDTSWTVLSYKIYGTIEHWWVLSSLNKENKFYAPEGSYIKFISNTYIKDILSKINN